MGKLPIPEFYNDGKPGGNPVVGNGWNTTLGTIAIRTARYTLPVPAQGAQKVRLTFNTNGKTAGEHIPIRFFIGTDPDSHKTANGSYPYTGELTIGSDWMTFTGEADILLIPGQTYYLWLFPGTSNYGAYYWERSGYDNTVETSGAGGVCCVMHNGEPWLGQIHVVKGGEFWIGLGYVAEDGALYLAGSP